MVTYIKWRKKCLFIIYRARLNNWAETYDLVPANYKNKNKL